MHKKTELHGASRSVILSMACLAMALSASYARIVPGDSGSASGRKLLEVDDCSLSNVPDQFSCTAYQHIGCRGSTWTFNTGSNVPRVSPNDQISAVVCGVNAQMTVWRDYNMQGVQFDLVGVVPDLKRYDFNDAISALKVVSRDDIQSSAQFVDYKTRQTTSYALGTTVNFQEPETLGNIAFWLPPGVALRVFLDGGRSRVSTIQHISGGRVTSRHPGEARRLEANQYLANWRYCDEGSEFCRDRTDPLSKAPLDGFYICRDEIGTAFFPVEHSCYNPRG